jgi:hypothetical protein
MQAAHSSTSRVGSPFAGVASQLRPLLVVVELPPPWPPRAAKLATVRETGALEEPEPPPHAASAMAAGATNTASPRDHR